jgi:hypothetical protein
MEWTAADDDREHASAWHTDMRVVIGRENSRFERMCLSVS